MQLRNQLAAIFSPTRRLDVPEQPLVSAGGRLGEVEWVVPRAECDYRRMDFARLPPRQRGPAAQIAARRHASAPASFHIAWTGPVAHVWTRSVANEDAAGPVRRWVPESLLRPAPGHDGPRLLRQVKGVEGQFWRDGQMQASQWWPEVPGIESWNRFVRSCGMSPDPHGVPEPEPVGWAEPWGDGRDRLPTSPATLERWAWHGVIGAVALALGWQLAADVRWAMARASIEDRTEALRAKAAPLLDARERAERTSDEIAALQALQAAHSDYDLVAAVIAPLPGDTRLLGWQREGDKLQADIASSASDPRVFVTAYASDPMLRDVVATPGANRSVRLAFDLPAPGEAP